MEHPRLPHSCPLPRLYISAAEFDRLPTYSLIPTGTIIGKRWRRDDAESRGRWGSTRSGKRWLVGEYVELGSKDYVGIRWYEPVIVDRGALSASSSAAW